MTGSVAQGRYRLGGVEIMLQQERTTLRECAYIHNEELALIQIDLNFSKPDRVNAEISDDESSLCGAVQGLCAGVVLLVECRRDLDR